MKKTLIAILAAMLILTSCAKNKNNIDDIRGSVVQIEDNTGTEDAADGNEAYINETFGIRFDIPDGWTVKDVDEYSDDDFMTFESEEGAMDFMAAAPGDLTSVNVSFGKFVAGSYLYEACGEKCFLENMLKEMPTDIFDNMTVSLETATVFGETHYIFVTDVVLNPEYTVTNAQAFVVKDDYLFVITAAALSKEEALEVLSHFQKI